MAIDSLQEGQNLLVSLEDTSDESKTSDFAEQLNALEHEIHGDRELENQNLNSAYSHYGRAIGKYRQHGMNDECRYLKQRRNLIKASLAEQEGDFSGAQEAHEEIANITNDNNFKKFNKDRVQIIKAKKQLNQLNIEEAKSELPRQPEATNIAYAEAQHIGFLLHTITSYEDNEIQNIGAVLDKLQELPDLSEFDEQFPFEYGHDYRPAVVNTLAAQRLRKFDIDEQLLDGILSISVNEVLTPERAQDEILESGISDINIQHQWKQYFPTHIVRRYQEIREKEITGVDNYADEGLALLRLVEQTLDFIADYFIQQDLGPDWVYEFADDSRLTLGHLRDILNTEYMSEIVWCDTVRELLDEPLIGEDSLIDARNALGHDRRSRINFEEYEEIRNKTLVILTRMRSQIPALVSVSQRTRLGPYELQIHWENAKKAIRIQADASLEEGCKYYIPIEKATKGPIVDIPSDQILPVQSERTKDNLEQYVN
ncbi:hypothetical protein SG26_01590 [Haloarcula sp. CBA1115]|nr:hypothetical protein SG26_01590 [Haloarcula sp. CBA1115]